MAAPDKRCTFDNVTEAATLSAANTATSGDAILTPVTSGTGSAVAKAAAAISGTKGVELTGVSGDVFSIGLSFTAAASGSTQVEFTSQTSMRPSAGVRNICRIRSGSPTGTNANAAIVIMNTSGVVSVQNAAGTNLKNFNSNTALADGDYVVNLRCTKGTTTSNGRILCTIRSKATGAIVSDGDYDSGTTVNAGTLDVTFAQTGIAAALTGNLTAHIDSFAVLSGSVAEIDLIASTTTPILVLHDNVAFIEIDSGGTDPQTINQTAGPTTTPTPGEWNGTQGWFVAKHATDTLTYVVTDALATDSDPIDVPPATGVSPYQRVRALSDLSGWDT